MQSIAMGLVFKHHYNVEASIEEEFRLAREGVHFVDVPNSLQQSRLRHAYL